MLDAAFPVCVSHALAPQSGSSIYSGEARLQDGVRKEMGGRSETAPHRLGGGRTGSVAAAPLAPSPRARLKAALVSEQNVSWARALPVDPPLPPLSSQQRVRTYPSSRRARAVRTNAPVILFFPPASSIAMISAHVRGIRRLRARVRREFGFAAVGWGWGGGCKALGGGGRGIAPSG